MDRAQLLPLVALRLGAVVAVLAGPAHGEDTARALPGDRVLDNVVLITASDNGHAVHGVGFIFGRFGESLWVATAAHVVFPDYGSDKPRSDQHALPLITVTLRGVPAAWALDRPPEFGFGGDIAFLSVHVPPAQLGVDRWSEPVVAQDAGAGTAVRLAGEPHEIVFGADVATVEAATPAGVRIPEPLGQEGQSGAPVVSADGIVGMYTNAGEYKMIPIRTIAEAARKADRPWQLTAAPPVLGEVALCLTAAGGTGRLVVSNARAVVALDAQGCVRTLAGTNRISSREPWVRCEPGMLELTAGHRITQEVACVVDPAGQWQTHQDGFLTLTYVGDGHWKLDGLQQSRVGWLSGMAMGRPPILTVTGTSAFGAALSGQLEVGPQRLVGRLQAGGTLLELEATR